MKTPVPTPLKTRYVRSAVRLAGISLAPVMALVAVLAFNHAQGQANAEEESPFRTYNLEERMRDGKVDLTLDSDQIPRFSGRPVHMDLFSLPVRPVSPGAGEPDFEEIDPWLARRPYYLR